MKEEDDATLVGQCLEGNRKAFEALIDRYDKRVFNVVLRLVHDPENARDLTQVVFLKAFEKLRQFDSSFGFYTWVYRIAVNESINFLKKENRFEPEPIDDQWKCGSRTPEESLVGAELSRSVQKSLMAISPDHRSVIVLRHFVGCSYRDMAQILDIPEKTVKSRLFTARQALRDILVRRSVK